MTRCKICGKGERAGGHHWKTGISNQTKPPHRFENNNLPDDKNEFGFKDKFVANRHKSEKSQK